MVIRVVLVEDHPIVRLGLHMLLDKEEDIEIVGEAESGREALLIVRAQKPDVVLVDIGLPDISGIEVTREIKRMNQEVTIIVLTIYDDKEYLSKMLAVGATGFVSKRIAPEVLPTAIRQAAQGETYIGVPA
jgi:DNA-binding NarL/FixJ family response regulator